MKLFKKLLPLASVTGVAAIVTPLATSCANKPFVLEHEGGVKSFTRETKVLDSSTKAFVLNGTEKYLSDVKENKKILAEDIMNYYVNEGYYGEGETLKKTVVTIGNVKPEKNEVSFDINLEIEVAGKIGEIDYTYDMNIDYSVKNLTFLVLYTSIDEGAPAWYFGPAAYLAVGSIESQIAYLKVHNDWSASLRVDMGHDVSLLEWDSTSTELELENGITKFFQYKLLFKPQYFAQVTPTGEK